MWNRLVALLTSVALGLGCGPAVMTPRLHEPSSPPASGGRSQSLKVHLRSGELLVLVSWRVAADGKILEGQGTRYTPLRQPAETGPVSVAVEDVAVLEANDSKVASSLAFSALAGLTLVFGAASGYCLANPKSCFGSCPTFYVEGDPERPRAEGFSASIARALEARDVDLLEGVRPREGRLAVWMRNEALETHAVRRVRLLSVRRPAGGRAFPTPEGVPSPAAAGLGRVLPRPRGRVRAGDRAGRRPGAPEPGRSGRPRRARGAGALLPGSAGTGRHRGPGAAEPHDHVPVLPDPRLHGP